MTYLELENILIRKMKDLYPECSSYYADVKNDSDYNRKTYKFRKFIRVSLHAAYREKGRKSESFYYNANNVAEAISILDQKFYGYSKTTKLEPNPENNERV